MESFEIDSCVRSDHVPYIGKVMRAKKAAICPNSSKKKIVAKRFQALSSSCLVAPTLVCVKILCVKRCTCTLTESAILQSLDTHNHFSMYGVS